jgi:ABC-2 type transport system permease protein
VTLNTDIGRGVSDRDRTLPIWRPAVIVGATIGDIGRYLLTSDLVIGLDTDMGFRPSGGPVGVLAGVGLVLVFSLALG